ncbi:MAG: hypothetical protein JEZ06_18330 [Anaerolineaceae bacterium]|nr:hypothetical protein [Anaerolineaceae bacterium]
MAERSQDKNIYQNLELHNALLIGFMVGIYEVLGKGGTQAVVNMAGNRVGRELIKFSQDSFVPIQSLEDFKVFVNQNKMIGELDFHETETTTFARISGCKTCPKKVGHYDFDGTACPWGGILSGVLSELTGVEHSAASKLSPGEKCVLEIRRAK